MSPLVSVSRPTLVVDVDGTITLPREAGQPYEHVQPRKDVIERLRAYAAAGYYIIMYSSRNMRTFEGNIGRINVETAPVLLGWLRAHEVPFDELVLGKPWAGVRGFYVDDRCVRPSEFVRLSEEELLRMTGGDE